MKVETERLSFERLTEAHAEELQGELCDPRVYQYIDDGEAPIPAELRESFSLREAGSPAHRSSENWLDFAVRSKLTGECIGRIEATILEQQAEVAYMFGLRHWGRGYAKEAVMWLERRIAEDYAVDSFWATVSPQNARSVALLARLGYSEAVQSSWPAKLTSYSEGDRVFHRTYQQPKGVA